MSPRKALAAPPKSANPLANAFVSGLETGAVPRGAAPETVAISDKPIPSGSGLAALLPFMNHVPAAAAAETTAPDDGAEPTPVPPGGSVLKLAPTVPAVPADPVAVRDAAFHAELIRKADRRFAEIDRRLDELEEAAGAAILEELSGLPDAGASAAKALDEITRLKSERRAVERARVLAEKQHGDALVRQDEATADWKIFRAQQLARQRAEMLARMDELLAEAAQIAARIVANRYELSPLAQPWRGASGKVFPGAHSMSGEQLTNGLDFQHAMFAAGADGALGRLFGIQQRVALPRCETLTSLERRRWGALLAKETAAGRAAREAEKAHEAKLAKSAQIFGHVLDEHPELAVQEGDTIKVQRRKIARANKAIVERGGIPLLSMPDQPHIDPDVRRYGKNAGAFKAMREAGIITAADDAARDAELALEEVEEETDGQE